MHIVIHNSLQTIDAVQWNALLSSENGGTNNPFMRHEFLNGLELTGCVSKETGWQASHFALYADDRCSDLLAAMPCYIKAHSYGEYIFDWAWADAYRRNGINYYPKLSNAIPFTPATGERQLVKKDGNQSSYKTQLIQAALAFVKEQELSSFHSLFLPEKDTHSLAELGLLTRSSSQFHWHNEPNGGYADFDAFLTKMSAKKRKNIKRERRRIVENKITYQWIEKDDLNESYADIMYRFYSRTIAQYGAQSYLNKAFFHYLVSEFKQQTLLLFASHNEEIIAGGIYFKSDNTLYGRYWGATDNFHSVHFETCYYQAIDWCIKHGYQQFEAGAQGEHKLARGLEPSKTYSSHYIADTRFRAAIDGFINGEQQQLEQYSEMMTSHSPFRKQQQKKEI